MCIILTTREVFIKIKKARRKALFSLLKNKNNNDNNCVLENNKLNHKGFSVSVLRLEAV